jgi:hypothetical protein
MWEICSVKCKGKIIPERAIKAHEGVTVCLQLFCALALDRMSGQLHGPAAVSAWKEPTTLIE